MPTTTRLYAGEDDYALMRGLLLLHVANCDDLHYCTLGDLDWWNAQSGDGPGSVRHAQLWFAEDGTLIGFVWPRGDSAELVAHPAHLDLFDAMLDWAEDGARASDQAYTTFSTYDFDKDDDRVARVARHGYRRLDDCFRYRQRPLGGDLPAPPIPAGFSVRNLGGEEDLERRVAVHRAAFHPSRMTVEKHRAVMASPTYRRELDLVVVAPDDSFAAYCIVWFDEVNRIGVFEPVGTHPDYQRRGLGKVVLAEGLRRLRDLGAERAFVISLGRGVAANALYESVGFRFIDETHAWEKAL